MVNSWTVTRVEGQYIAGGFTRRFWSIPDRLAYGSGSFEGVRQRTG